MKAFKVHPGEILAEELESLGLSASQFAGAIGVPPNRITQILSGQRAVSADTALRLGHWFGMSAKFWMNLQIAYDLAVAEEKNGSAISELPTKVA